MGHALVNMAVVLILFCFGIGWTVYRYGRRNRLAFAVVAVVSPVIALVAFLVVIVRLLAGNRTQMGPCPDGLPEAERLVEEERQKLFGGDLREPAYSKYWQRAYEIELQREAAKVQSIAQKVFVNA